MKQCIKCRNKVSHYDEVCDYCGASLTPTSLHKNTSLNTSDYGGFGWSVVGFLVPIVGLILYLVWFTERPKTARAAGFGALISVGVSMLAYMMVFLFIYRG